MSISLKSTLKSLRDVTADPAVSVLVKTHRTHPANEQDPIALKNALSELAQRVSHEYNKRLSDTIIGHIQNAISNHDHQHNLDTLAVFATPDEARVLTLPIDVTPRVVVAKQFATRELVRELSHSVHYYAVVVTRTHARLIEATGDRVVKEFTHNSSEQAQPDFQNQPFPIENNTLYTTSGAERSGASNEDNYLKEFLNRVDKSVQELIGKTGEKIPLFVIGDARNVSFYKDVCDRPELIVGSADNVTDLETGSPEHLIKGLQPAVKAYHELRQTQAKGKIDIAKSQNKLAEDVQNIYRLAHQGVGETLFVRIGYLQPAVVDEASQTLTLADDPSADGVTDDVVSDIIQAVSSHGGDVVFLPKELMETDIALITRY
ncbi:MAG: hypothetical protein Q3971_07275 [Moraxella sp.]|nr:hypothetical protein [Moraxella sp.]